MKIAFYSNFLNHHQLPLCQAFLMQEDVEFVFVATDEISKDRLDMGYADMNKEYPFVVRAYESEQAKLQAEELAKDADVMIFGAAPLKYLELRMQLNKLTFYFCERPLKKGYWRRFIPTTRSKLKNQFVRYKDKNLYVLGASAYTAYDLKLCGFNENKCFKWGYFPEIKGKDVERLIKAKKEKDNIEILYAGRLLKLKRVIDFAKAIKILVKQGITNFSFSIVGDGQEKEQILRYIKKKNLTSYIKIRPFQSAKEIRSTMDLADIYVFGSDFNEGWGAVVNEAMNSACAVVVSHAVGSSAFLIESGKNGFIYECGNIKSIAECLKKLLLNEKRRLELSRQAYNEITNHWTAEIAAKRLKDLSTAFLNNGEITNVFEEGVCSRANLLKNNWIKRRV